MKDTDGESCIERRRWVRYALHNLARQVACVLELADQRLSCSLVDISYGGAQVMLLEAACVVVGQSCKFMSFDANIPLPQNVFSKIEGMAGQIRWADEKDGRIGVQFANLIDKDAVSQLAFFLEGTGV